ncbi:MAG: hypothetical protein R3300_05515 [Candidatus Promineifilaceae bacterium]|nr:hypothetical protein [Candidatus Promineifilaceae bacterium]
MTEWDEGAYRRRRNRPALRLTPTSILLVGLLLGLAAGLSYAWLLEPVAYVGAAPARLSQSYRQEYLRLVGESYLATGDWPGAQARLSRLDDPNLAQTVAEQLEEALRQGRPATELRSLAVLAGRLGVDSPAVALFAAGDPGVVATPTLAAALEIPPTWTPTRQSPSTVTPLASPTAGPTPTPLPVYRLLRRERVCAADAAATRIEVEILDSTLEPEPGVEVEVRWEGGSDHFFTGYWPDRSLGYGDFSMTGGIVYNVRVADGSPIVDGLRVTDCPNGLQGGWRLTFQNSAVFGQP